MAGQRRRDRMANALSLTFLRPGRPGPGDKPPLFVIGSGRSGNTLVRRVLMASGEIYIPPETYVLGEIIETWQRGALLPWRERVWLFCAYFERHQEFTTFGLEDLSHFAAQATALPPEARNLRALTDAFYFYLARSAGSDAPRWGDKTPYNTKRLPTIARLFPDAQYLWLVRDGRDVALSYVQAGLYPDLATAADRWREANAACMNFADGRHDIRRQSYEDLVADPETQFRQIFDWAGLRFEPAMLNADTQPLGDVETRAHHRNVRRPITATAVGRWREELSGTDKAALAERVGKMLTTLGYPEA